MKDTGLGFTSCGTNFGGKSEQYVYFLLATKSKNYAASWVGFSPTLLRI
jgi:hypothetical protein